MWNVATTQRFDKWFVDLDADIQVEVIARVNLLKEFGPALRRPHADTLNGSKHANMKELRVDEQGHVIRVAFAFDPERSAVLLVAGEKQGQNQQRFYKRLIADADRLYDDHLAKLKG